MGSTEQRNVSPPLSQSSPTTKRPPILLKIQRSPGTHTTHSPTFLSLALPVSHSPCPAPPPFPETLNYPKKTAHYLNHQPPLYPSTPLDLFPKQPISTAKAERRHHAEEQGKGTLFFATPLGELDPSPAFLGARFFSLRASVISRPRGRGEEKQRAKKREIREEEYDANEMHRVARTGAGERTRPTTSRESSSSRRTARSMRRS